VHLLMNRVPSLRNSLGISANCANWSDIMDVFERTALKEWLVSSGGSGRSMLLEEGSRRKSGYLNALEVRGEARCSFVLQCDQCCPETGQLPS
jgi:hypothetical protein